LGRLSEFFKYSIFLSAKATTCLDASALTFVFARGPELKQVKEPDLLIDNR
jgi:hypothetical protein